MPERVEQGSPPEDLSVRPHYAAPLGVSIGRPADPAWVSSFAVGFEEYRPDGLVLVMKRLPGVIYATGPELNHATGDKFVGPHAEQLAEREIDTFLDMLYATDKLDPEVAKESLPLPSRGVQLKRVKGNENATRVAIVLADKVVPDPDEEERYYYVDTERNAVLDQLGIPPDSRGRMPRTNFDHTPKHRLMLGIIEGPKTIFSSREFLDLMCKKLASEVELLKIGTVKS